MNDIIDSASQICCWVKIIFFAIGGGLFLFVLVGAVYVLDSLFQGAVTTSSSGPLPVLLALFSVGSGSF